MSGARGALVLAVVAVLGCGRAAQPPQWEEPPRLAPEPRTDPSPVVEIPPPPAVVMRTGRLPAVAFAEGRLRIDVVHPPAGSQLPAVDSTFILGSIGHGGAALTINGVPVRVWPNGAWLAWLGLPAGETIDLEIAAHVGADTARSVHRLRRTAAFREPARGPWIDTTSFEPRGDVWWPANEFLTFAVRAAPGSAVALVLADGVRVPLVPVPGYAPTSDGVQAFDRDTLNLRGPLRIDRFEGILRGRAIGPDPGPILPGAVTGRGGGRLTVESIVGRDTARASWPLRLALLDTLPVTVEVDDDWQGTGTTDSLVPGRALPGGSYHWFFPTGTRLVAAGRWNGDLRVRLAPGTDAWVAVAEVRPLGAGAAMAPVTAGSVTVGSTPAGTTIRIPLTGRPPLQVEEERARLTLTVYGARGDLDWIRHAPGRDPLVEQIRWRQRGPDLAFVVDLAVPVWGYRLRWERHDLLLDIRAPPAIDPREPLRGRLIAVDAGHPPGGSTGPTRLTEAEANLAVARRVANALRRAGARVVMTRDADLPVDLWPRVRDAERAGAELLVSIHNNALPDGVNPWTNHGASVFYHQPRSLPLARTVQEELVRSTGLPDLGVARGDLALIRTTWMPSVLTEGMFMIVPEQEAALRTTEGQERYAAGVVEGIRRFLLWRQAGDRTSP